ncbi:unnamed protein product [Dicrocoelium dendriticum]|nr:unnamed protein product [Dicrocoelium dendriticum]
MTLHKHEWSANEQETPARIQHAFKRCQEEGLVIRCMLIPARHISEEALSLVHSRAYIQSVKRTQNFSLPDLYKFSGQFDGVFVNSHTWSSASLAAGSLQHLAKLVVQGKLSNGFAFLRPPGHHAMYSEACGYCLFNNVAVVASSFLYPPPTVLQACVETKKSVTSKRYGKRRTDLDQHELTHTRSQGSESRQICRKSSLVQLQRILIVDWDVHHGQGTQYAFYNDNRVLFISIHRYENSTFWPNLREANFDFIGEGSGRGYNINIPLEETGLTDSDYLTIFHQLVMPIATEFDPQLVIISCGFDAAIGCPEGRMWLTPAVFGHLVHHLKMLANGKLVVTLEGGYYIDSMAESTVHVIKALLGDPLTPVRLTRPVCKSTLRTIDCCVTALRAHWKSLWLHGVSKTINRPNLANLPLVSWPLVKRVVWPESNPVLPDQVKQRVRLLMDSYIPLPLPPSSCHSILLLVPSTMCSTNQHASSTRNYDALTHQARPDSQCLCPDRLLHHLSHLFHLHVYRTESASSTHSMKRGGSPASSHCLPSKRTCREKHDAPMNEHKTPDSRCSHALSFRQVFASSTESQWRKCGCSFATIGSPYSKKMVAGAPDMKAALRIALNELLLRRFSRLLLLTDLLDLTELLSAISEIHTTAFSSYQERIFRTRIQITNAHTRDSLSHDEQPEMKSLSELTDGLFYLRTAVKSSGLSIFDRTRKRARERCTRKSTAAAQPGTTSNSNVCRLFVVDLFGTEEPFSISDNLCDTSAHDCVQCDLLLCSVYSGCYAEELAKHPKRLRVTALRRLLQRPEQRIRFAHWLRLPVVDSVDLLDRNATKSEAAGYQAIGANLLALILHLLLPLAYEFGPDLIYIRLGDFCTGCYNVQMDISTGILIHLFSGLGIPVLISLCSFEALSASLINALLGRPLPMNPNPRDSMVPTPAMQSVLREILLANGSQWKNLRFTGFLPLWQ